MEALIDIVRENHGAWSLAVIFLGAALEYMVPPLPADSVVLAGALLVLSGAYPFATVAVVAITGGFLGALSHYYIGRALQKDDGGFRGGRWMERLTGRGSVERFFAVFRKYGIWVIAINRAFPGVRAVTFIAAGGARLPFVPTMLLGLVSNIAWTLTILALGVSVGESWEKIEAALSVYSTVIYSILGVLLTAYVVYRIIRKRRRVVASDGQSEQG